MVRRAVLPALLAAAALLALPHAAQAALQFRSCVDLGGLRCATLAVPLDRSGATPGSVNLRIARGGRSAGPTLLYLSGGPGGAGITEMANVVGALPWLERSFRLIGFDQRGTGRSGLLRCPRLERDKRLNDTGAAEACANQIGVARRFYTTPDSVQDIEAIRAELGVEKLTLFGISYGTELAIAYARAYPQHVERLILDSVLDLDSTDPFSTASYRAMGPSLLSLCPARCRGLTNDPGGELAQLVAQLRAKPLQAFAYDALGRSQRVNITVDALLELMFLTDYLPPLRATLPAAVHAAVAGDGALLARAIRESRRFDALGSPRDFSVARYATVCETTPLPWAPGTPVDQRGAITQQALAAVPENAFAPFDRAVATEDFISLCLRWPDVPRPPAAAAPAYPTVPTLILQGAEDLRTPQEGSAAVAARIPGSIRLVIPGVGHSTISDPRACSGAAIRAFVRGTAMPRCRRVPTGVPAVDGAPASFESLESYPGLPLKVGRTVRAAALTIDDLGFLLSSALGTSGGGLRGGSWAIDADRLRLRDYQAVTGVTLSGTIRRTFTVRIAGTKAAKGTLTYRSNRLTGRVGGRKISVRLTAPRVSALSH
jgi:pimeloyl-ACP methyl ester carboxylesterase